jgi:putative acetyltransferase
VVRAAVVGDAAGMYAVSAAAILGSAAGAYTGAQLRAWVGRRSVAGHVAMVERTTAFVAEEDGAVVGFATVALEAGHGLVAGEVDQLFVRPEAGGRGVARALLAAVEDAARGAGLTGLVTHASWRAVPVFERYGYEQVEVETVAVGDQELTRALMRKRLSRS